MDVEIIGLMLTIIVAAIALAAQRRADMKLMNRRFDDMYRHFDKRFDAVDKRIEAVERQQREFSVALAGMGKDVAQLAGRVDELAGLVSSAFQAVIGVVVARGDRKDRGSSVAQQASFSESVPSED